MDRTNYCADCEQRAREAATLRAQLAAKDEEIAGLKSNALRRRLEIESEQRRADAAEAKQDTARLVAAADEVLSLFSSPRPLPDSAVYMCGAEAGVRTLEALRAAIDDAREGEIEEYKGLLSSE